MIRKEIKQRDITDCGAACLASVAAHYKLKLSVAKIRQMAATNTKGTSVMGMLQAAEKMGFSAKGVRGNAAALQEINYPAIAHVQLKSGLLHFVVLYRLAKEKVQYMDPADGRMHVEGLEAFLEKWTGVLLLIMPHADFQAGDHTISIWQRFGYLLRPHRSVLLQALVGAILYTVLGLASSLYVQKLVDTVFVGGNVGLLHLLSCAMLLILLFQMGIGFLKNLFVFKVGQKIDARLILGYYKHVLRLPQSFFDSMRVGEIVSRINDAVKIRLFINDTLIGLVVNVCVVLFSFALMLLFYWKLALILLAIIPIYALLYVITNKLNKKTERKLMEDGAELDAHLVESLNGIGTIKRFGAEEFVSMKMETRFTDLLRSVYRSGMVSFFTGTSSEFVSRAFALLIMWVGAGYVLQQALSPGELMSFYALSGYLTGPISALVGMNKTIQNAWIAADRLFEIMELTEEEKEVESVCYGLPAEPIRSIRFEQVHFRYGAKAPVFTDFSAEFQAGKISALVGESGSGKSTLMALLQGIYPLEKGKIWFGGHELRYLTPESLRERIAVVPQDVTLFAGDLLSNIALGDYSPDVERVLELCSRLGMDSFIDTLPQGLATHVGEHGATLSGGQKQRIALARALYRNPEIVILDEATAALDAHSERIIQQCLLDLAQQGKTILCITHRLAAVQPYDEIFVLAAGRVVEKGNHRQLISLQGVYYEMIRKQAVFLQAA